MDNKRIHEILELLKKCNEENKKERTPYTEILLSVPSMFEVYEILQHLLEVDIYQNEGRLFCSQCGGARPGVKNLTSTALEEDGWNIYKPEPGKDYYNTDFCYQCNFDNAGRKIDPIKMTKDYWNYRNSFSKETIALKKSQEDKEKPNGK